MSPPAPSPESWVLWRQDDHGHRFAVRVLPTRDEALALAAELEAKGHKQTYWVEPGAELR